MSKQNKLEIDWKSIAGLDTIVLYMAVETLPCIQKELLNEVKKIKDIKLDKFDIKLKPHATICYGNTKDSFDKIWSYLKTLDKPKFKLKFDNITILSKPKKVWKIYRVYKLKGV